MHRAALILALWALALPALAFDNDYTALFEAHADKVQQATPGERILELPGPVVVREITTNDGRRIYRDWDHSGLGTPGCTFRGLIDLVALAGVCEVGSTQDRATLEQYLRRAADYVGANVYPPMKPAEVQPQLVQRLSERIGLLTDQDTAGQCATDDFAAAKQVVTQIVTALATSAGKADMDRIFSTPRLVTREPCNVRD